MHFLDHGFGTKDAVAPAGYKCSYAAPGSLAVCGLRFETRKDLNKHKREEEHIKSKKNGQEENDEDLDAGAEGNGE